MNIKPVAISMLALAAAACATTPGAVNTPSATVAPAIPSTPLDLGDWRGASQGAASSQFERAIGQRYASGLSLSAVTADLQSARFSCAAAPRGASDPPAQVCRKTEDAGGCTHSWRVVLYATGQTFDRARPIYDRACGGDGLLGGPS